MSIAISILSLCLIAMIAFGFYFEFKPLNSEQIPYTWLKGSIAINLLSFVLALLVLLFMGIQEVMAIPNEAVNEIVNEAVVETVVEGINSTVSIGKGLAIIGIGLPTCFATIAAGMAVGPIGAASLAAISEKSENFGRSLIYLGLAEGIAIYGLVISILLMGKI
jgi:V/A-type H+/Na+-transporting ATPase subunit K